MLYKANEYRKNVGRTPDKEIIFHTQEEEKMAFVVGSGCVGCMSCVAACPVEAIEDAGGVAKIDESKCVNCGTCAAQCPVSAIEEG